MTTLAPKTKFASAKKLLLALPFLALLVAMVPTAQADDHHRNHRRGYNRHHQQRSYHRRHYYYRHGRRYYGYEPGYYRPRTGVSVNVGL